MLTRFTRTKPSAAAPLAFVFGALLLLDVVSTSACITVGEIGEQDYVPPRKKRDGGVSPPSDAPDDPAPPPPDDPPPDPPPPETDSGAPPPAPPPSTDSGAPPPPTDGGAAPPPPADGGGAPPPVVDSGAPPPPVVDSGPPAPPPTGAYPSGPYGFSTGSVFPNVSVDGYRDGTGTYGAIKLSDYYDPDGSRKINGLFIAISAAWCGACQSEAKALPGEYLTYKPRGARFLSALIENTSGGPATQSTVDSWIKAFKTNYDMAADPSRVLLPGGSVALPHNYLVDPRTMKVVKMWEGSDGTIPGLDALLTKNGG